MTQEELYVRLLCLETSFKKVNYRIYLLEKEKSLKQESKKFYENKITSTQLSLFESDQRAV
jgi:hypothetical protein